MYPHTIVLYLPFTSKFSSNHFVYFILIRNFATRSGSNRPYAACVAQRSKNSGQTYKIESIRYYFALSQNAQETVWNKKRSEVIEM